MRSAIALSIAAMLAISVFLAGAEKKEKEAQKPDAAAPEKKGPEKAAPEKGKAEAAKEGGFEKPLPESAMSEIQDTQSLQMEQLASGQLSGAVVATSSSTQTTEGTAAEAAAIATQAAEARRWAGVYQVVSGSNRGTLNINADGTLTGSGVNKAGQTGNITGFINNSGAVSFTGAEVTSPLRSRTVTRPVQTPGASGAKRTFQVGLPTVRSRVRGCLPYHS